MIVTYLEKDIEALKNKNPDDLKKIIQTYVEKIVIYAVSTAFLSMNYSLLLRVICRRLADKARIWHSPTARFAALLPGKSTMHTYRRKFQNHA